MRLLARPHWFWRSINHLKNPGNIGHNYLLSQKPKYKPLFYFHQIQLYRKMWCLMMPLRASLESAMLAA